VQLNLQPAKVGRDLLVDLVREAAGDTAQFTLEPKG
jgi:hypothetical protein